MDGYRCEDKKEFIKDYRFNIAFENTSMNGYVTEKIIDAFAAGCIPIYYGDPSIYEDFNKGSFINVADFPSFDECIDYVLYVDEHPEVYESIIRTPAFTDSTIALSETYEDQILKAVHDIVDSSFRIRRQPGLGGVFSYNNPCPRPNSKHQNKGPGILKKLFR